MVGEKWMCKNLWVICGILGLTVTSFFKTKTKLSVWGGHVASLRGGHSGRRTPIRMASKCICSAFTGYVYKTDAAASCNSHIFPWHCHAEHFQKAKLPCSGSLLFLFLIAGDFSFGGLGRERGLLFFWNQMGKENRVVFSPTTGSL